MNLRKDLISRLLATEIKKTKRYLPGFKLLTVIFLATILCASKSGFAQEQDYGIKDNDQSLRFTGATLVNGANNFKMFTPGTESRYIIKNVVTLSLNEETTSFIPNDFDATKKKRNRKQTKGQSI